MPKPILAKPMKVYVIMANDFPHCVFAEEPQATAYVARKRTEENDKAAFRFRPRIYWMVHAFELIK